MLTIMAAAIMALPDPGEELDRAIRHDVGRDLLRSDLAALFYEAAVDEQGRIESCRVRGSFGDPIAARKLCKLIVGKQVPPGRGPDGKALPATFRATYFLADNSFPDSMLREKADILSEVVSLPGGAKDPVRIDLVVRIDDTGAITDCLASGGPSASGRTACEQVRGVPMPVRKSAAGQPESYLYPLVFEFTPRTSGKS